MGAASFLAGDFPESRAQVEDRGEGMALRSTPLLLLVLGALRESCFGSSLHSMKYLSTSISDKSQGLPDFVVLGYLDDQVFVHYDSKRRKFQPRVHWMEKEDSEYWDRYTKILQDNEEMYRKDLENLRSRFNHSKGFHTWQRLVSCERQGNISKGLWQYGYDGRTFIAFDKDTLTWEAFDPHAQVTQRKWNAVSGLNKYTKSYLEEECIEWLEKFRSYRNKTLQSTEAPKVTVSSRTEVEDGMEMHVCRIDGFYPRDIDASWTRDGEVWLQDTFHGSVAPNADGTYHYWLSVRIDPKERDRYRCHVEHDGLQDPLDVALKEPTNSKSKWELIIGCVMAVLAVIVIVIVGIWAFIYFRKRRQKRRQNDCNAAQTPEEGSNCLDQGSNQVLLEPSCSASGHSQHEEREEKMELNTL